MGTTSGSGLTASRATNAPHPPSIGLSYNAAERLMNLPNALTVTRIFLVPLLVVVLLTKFEGHALVGVPTPLVGAAIFGLASFTDWLDGFLARRRGQVTSLGRMMDPIADKLLTSAAFISLVQLGCAPLDGGGHHRPRAGGDGPAQPGVGPWRRVRRVDARQDQDGVAGHRDPAADLGQNGAQPFGSDRWRCGWCY